MPTLSRQTTTTETTRCGRASVKGDFRPPAHRSALHNSFTQSRERCLPDIDLCAEGALPVLCAHGLRACSDRMACTAAVENPSSWHQSGTTTARSLVWSLVWTGYTRLDLPRPTHTAITCVTVA